VLLADLLGGSGFTPPPSAFAAAAEGAPAHAAVAVSSAVAESTLPRARVLEMLGLRPELGASLTNPMLGHSGAPRLGARSRHDETSGSSFCCWPVGRVSIVLRLDLLL
jgi:hypothetical protein